jgi:hypothetical protein
LCARTYQISMDFVATCRSIETARITRMHIVSLN